MEWVITATVDGDTTVALVSLGVLLLAFFLTGKNK